jgi:hypothetical protein
MTYSKDRGLGRGNMSYSHVHDIAVRLMQGEVIEVTDHRERRWKATHEALVRTDDGRSIRAAEGAYDVAVVLCWWVATERIRSLWPAVSAVA